jgi:hypothetical protein
MMAAVSPDARLGPARAVRRGLALVCASLVVLAACAKETRTSVMDEPAAPAVATQTPAPAPAPAPAVAPDPAPAPAAAPAPAPAPAPAVASKPAADAPQPSVGLIVGCRAPDFEATDVDGVRFKLSDYRGKVVVLDFWGFW